MKLDAEVMSELTKSDKNFVMSTQLPMTPDQKQIIAEARKRMNEFDTTGNLRFGEDNSENSE